jgi:alpha-L-arabinofuranosidase
MEETPKLSRRQIIGAAAGAALSADLLRSAPDAPVAVRISSRRLSEVPIERTIFGQFIEAGFGRQVEGMWAEMLYNRSFQTIPPFSQWTWDWLGLKPEAYNPAAPFWHSGYEENDWELTAPNNSTRSRTLGTDTYKGKSSFVLTYDGGGTQGGLRQRGIYLKAGETYDFRIFGCVAAPRGSTTQQPVKIVFRSSGSPGGVLSETSLSFESTQKEFHCEFVNQRYTGRAAIEVVLDRSATLRLSWVSLMPRHTVHGWRNDVVALLKQVSPPIIRFPGGCYGSFHDWKKAVGPRSKRPAEESFYWGDLDENDVGIDEFLDLCHEIGAEPQILVNMMTTNSFDAADLVEYCNGADSTRMGRFRKHNGVTRQNHVTYWEMENEARRKWSAPAYAAKVVEFAAAMREVDSKIRIMMENYSYGPDALPGMLAIAGKSIDLVITRASDRLTIARLLEIIRAYNRDNGTQLRLANTEWLAFRDDAPEPFADPEIARGLGRAAPTADYRKVKSFHQIHWFYAVNTARILCDFLAQGGELNSTNFNNCVNTWGQNIIEASKEGAWLSPVGHVYKFLASLDARYPLETTTDNVAGTFVDAQACEIKDGGIEIVAVNRGTKAAALDLRLQASHEIHTMEAIYADDRLAHCSLNRCAIEVEDRHAVHSNTIVLRPLSVSRIQARRA